MDDSPLDISKLALAYRATLRAWDVMDRAVAESRAGEAGFELFVEYLMANIHDSVRSSHPDLPTSVAAEFVVDTMSDIFDFEVDFRVAHPISRIISTLYEECVAGKSAGMDTAIAAAARAAAGASAGEVRSVPYSEMMADVEEAAVEEDDGGWTTVKK